jgi:hypothetical protein
MSGSYPCLRHLVLKGVLLKNQILQLQEGFADTEHHLGAVLRGDLVEAGLLQQGLGRLGGLSSDQHLGTKGATALASRYFNKGTYISNFDDFSMFIYFYFSRALYLLCVDMLKLLTNHNIV